MNCESCGMPMKAKEDFGGGKAGNKYCRYCSDARGKLKSRAEVRKGWIGYIVKTEGLPPKEAEKLVDTEMKKMPAWKK